MAKKKKPDQLPLRRMDEGCTVSVTSGASGDTNGLKHFKWTPRGKRRLHEKPNRGEILACRFWFEREIAHIKPRAAPDPVARAQARQQFVDDLRAIKKQLKSRGG